MGNIPRLDFFGLGLHPYSWIYEREFSTSLSIYMRDFKGVDLQRRVCKGVDIQTKPIWGNTWPGFYNELNKSFQSLEQNAENNWFNKALVISSTSFSFFIFSFFFLVSLHEVYGHLYPKKKKKKSVHIGSLLLFI